MAHKMYNIRLIRRKKEFGKKYIRISTLRTHEIELIFVDTLFYILLHTVQNTQKLSPLNVINTNEICLSITVHSKKY